MSTLETSDYQCSNCRAKLFRKRLREPRKHREEAFCPYCMVNLPPRSGKDTLHYTLVEAPMTRKRPRDTNLAKKAAAFVTWKKI